MSARGKMRLILAGVIGLQGCAGVPTQFYSLEATAPTPAVQERPVSAPPLIGVTQMTLPNVLERKQITARDTQGELVIFEQHQWAGLLKQNMTEVMTKNLSNLYPQLWFKAYPWSTLGMVDYRLVIDVTQLTVVMGKTIMFAADWTLIDEKTHAVIAHEPISLERPLQDNTVPQVVAQLNQLLTEFAQTLSLSPRLRLKP